MQKFSSLLIFFRKTFKLYTMASISVLNYQSFNKHAQTFDHTTLALPFFFFPDAGLLVCIKPGRTDTSATRLVNILHTAFAGLPRQQWLQQLYGQGYREYRRYKKSKTTNKTIVLRNHSVGYCLYYI